MLCIWWDIRGLIHYDIPKPKEKLNLENCCQQPDNYNTAVQEKRPGTFTKKNIIMIMITLPHSAFCRTRLINSVALTIFPGFGMLWHLLFFLIKFWYGSVEWPHFYLILYRWKFWVRSLNSDIEVGIPSYKSEYQSIWS